MSLQNVILAYKTRIFCTHFVKLCNNYVIFSKIFCYLNK